MIDIINTQADRNKNFCIADIMPAEIMQGVSQSFRENGEYYCLLEELVGIYIRTGRQGESVPDVGIINTSDKLFIDTLQDIVNRIGSESAL